MSIKSLYFLALVQQIYRGWALLGIVVAGALLSTLILALMVRKERKAFVFALIAFLCIAGTQLVFWKEESRLN